jgi:hypothetical protein
LSPTSTLAVISPVVPYVLGGAAAAYLLLLAVVVLTAVLHADQGRRADARRVLGILLSVLTRRHRS